MRLSFQRSIEPFGGYEPMLGIYYRPLNECDPLLLKVTRKPVAASNPLMKSFSIRVLVIGFIIYTPRFRPPTNENQNGNPNQNFDRAVLFLEVTLPKSIRERVYRNVVEEIKEESLIYRRKYKTRRGRAWVDLWKWVKLFFCYGMCFVLGYFPISRLVKRWLGL